ncbi:MAG: response regulator, partial [Rhizobiaceae bacterium]|nr:response regulator [Rhizobiaceae bacterium]
RDVLKGPGLGPSVHREISRALNGKMPVQRRPHPGSLFSPPIPLDGPPFPPPPRRDQKHSKLEAVAISPGRELDDDRNAIGIDDRVVLIVEDDTIFRSALLLTAREAGLKAVVSETGSGTLALARKLMPDAITLDLRLADIDGWVLFDLLRHDPKTGSIPIHIISGVQDIDALLDKGAASVAVKPVPRDVLRDVFESIHDRSTESQRSVLVCEAENDRRASLAEAIRDRRTKVTSVHELAEDGHWEDYDAIILGVRPSTAEDVQVFEKALSNDQIRTRLIVWCAAPEKLQAAAHHLYHYKQVTIVENLAELLDFVGAGTIGMATTGAPERTKVESVAGARVMIIDDDIRNIFTLTSVLESWNVEVLHAESGAQGIEYLEKTPDVDLALIDIMMPEMDGYETIQEIKRRPAIADIPLISVTAKAMKGDRKRCLDAGASDYISKPVDLDLLLALLRVWVARSRSRRQNGKNAISNIALH